VHVLRGPAGLQAALERAQAGARGRRDRGAHRAPPPHRGLLQRRQLLHRPPAHGGDLPRPAGRGRARALVRHRPRRPAAAPDGRPAGAPARERLLQGERGRRERQPRAPEADQEGDPRRGGAGDRGEAAPRRHRRALLVHRGLPAGAGGQPRRDLSHGEGAARDRRLLRDAHLLLRAVPGHRARAADAGARLRDAAAARGLARGRPRPLDRPLDTGAGAQVGAALQLLSPPRLRAARRLTRPEAPAPRRACTGPAGFLRSRRREACGRSLEACPPGSSRGSPKTSREQGSST